LVLKRDSVWIKVTPLTKTARQPAFKPPHTPWAPHTPIQQIHHTTHDPSGGSVDKTQAGADGAALPDGAHASPPAHPFSNQIKKKSKKHDAAQAAGREKKGTSEYCLWMVAPPPATFAERTLGESPVSQPAHPPRRYITRAPSSASLRKAPRFTCFLYSLP
jgi:hypothetical protein